MRDELDKLLCDRYPKIFADRPRSIKESAMGFGFSCGDGWFDLIDTLCERLQHETDHNNAPQIIASQVKEKFGALRFYVRNGATDEQWGMIAMAEAMSSRICDECGKPAQRLGNDLWVRTRCPEHAPVGGATSPKNDNA